MKARRGGGRRRAEYDGCAAVDAASKGRSAVRVRSLGVAGVIATSFALGGAGCCCNCERDGSAGTLEREEAMDRAKAGMGLVGEWVVREIRGERVGHIAGGDGSTMRSPTMTITNDGSVSGFGGVNRFFGALNDPTTPAGSVGEAELITGAFELGPLGSTMMAGPEGPSRVETMLFGALDDAASYELHGDRLTLKDAAGTVVATLDRKP